MGRSNSQWMFGFNVLGKEILKVHKCKFENLPISSSSYENNMLKISHQNTFYFLRYAQREIYEKFVCKHSETIRYVKN